MVNRRLELVFIDKNGKWYPLDEVNRRVSRRVRKNFKRGRKKVAVAKRAKMSNMCAHFCFFVLGK